MSDEAPPVCYRHPGKETYVHCVRCDKPICPDCMREAPVGFQCVECVKEGARTLRAVSGQFETKKVRTVGQTNPLANAVKGNVTKILIGLNVLAFLAQGGLSSGLTRGSLSNNFTFDYAMIGGAKDVVGVADGQYYRLITAAFLHSGILHIAFNMLALYQLGSALERVLGTWRYLGLYFAGAIGGNVLVYVVDGSQAAAVGASTSIYGLFAAFYLVARRNGNDTSQLVALIVINFLITITVPNISIWGHVGGFVTGGIVGLIYTKISTQQARLQAGLIGGLIALLFAVAVGVTASL